MDKSPNELDHCGSSNGSTVVLLDGTSQVTVLFIRPINIYPPSSVVMSQKTYKYFQRKVIHAFVVSYTDGPDVNVEVNLHRYITEMSYEQSNSVWSPAVESETKARSVCYSNAVV